MRLVLILALLVPVHAHAILVTFENSTPTSIDFTVDWSDGVVFPIQTVGAAQSYDGSDWVVFYDKLTSINSFINILIDPKWDARGGDFHQISLFWMDPVPIAEQLERYFIYEADTPYVSFVSQADTSITFHVDNNGEAIIATPEPVPDTGSTAALLALALIGCFIIQKTGLKPPARDLPLFR